MCIYATSEKELVMASRGADLLVVYPSIRRYRPYGGVKLCGVLDRITDYKSNSNHLFPFSDLICQYVIHLFP